MRTIVVAGGTSGIGKASAEKFLDSGDQVICIGKTRAHLDALDDRPERHHRLHIFQADLACQDNISNLIHDVSNITDHVDVLVNSIGTIGSTGVNDESFDGWRHVISNNLDAVFLAIKTFLPFLKEAQEDKSIVNVSSVCSLRPCASLSYSVSKAGVDMLTKSCAKDLASDGIRVNAVNPGVVRTELQKSAGLFQDETAYEQWVDKMKDTHPLGNVGEATDVAETIKFLASPEAHWITGTIVSVDGGRAIA